MDNILGEDGVIDRSPVLQGMLTPKNVVIRCVYHRGFI